MPLVWLVPRQLVPAVWQEGFVIVWLRIPPCKARQCGWCLAELVAVVPSGTCSTCCLGNKQVTGAGVVLSVACAVLGDVHGSAVLQAAAPGQVTASPPAVALTRDGIKVLPATPSDPW